MNAFIFLIALAAVAPAAKKDPAADINAPARRRAARGVRGQRRHVDVGRRVARTARHSSSTSWATSTPCPSAGGTARALTSGPAWDCSRAFRRTAKTIAFSYRPRRHRERLADGRRRQAPARPHRREGQLRPQPRVVARRRPTSSRARKTPSARVFLPSSCGCTTAKAAGASSSTPPTRWTTPRGRSSRRTAAIYFFSSRQPRFNYTPDLSRGLWQIMRYDRATGETLPMTSGFGGGGAAGAVARRQDAHVPEPARHRHRARAAGPRIGRGEGDRDRTVARTSRRASRRWTCGRPTPSPPTAAAIVLSEPRQAAAPRGGRRRDVREIPFTAKVEQWLAPRVAWQEKVDDRRRCGRASSAGPASRRTGSGSRSTPSAACGCRSWPETRPCGSPRRVTSDAAGLPSREYAPQLLARRQVDRVRDVERRRGRPRVEGLARRRAAAAHAARPATTRTRRGRPRATAWPSSAGRAWSSAAGSPRTRTSSRWDGSTPPAARCIP